MSRRIYFPAPPVHEAEDRCPHCQGQRVTGEQYGMETGSGTTIVIDALCPHCDGCGRDKRHASCTPMDHADWQPGDYDEDGEPQEIDERACASCDGRQWNAVLGWTDGAGPDREQLMHHLRVPCGCAEPLMVRLDEEPDPAPALPQRVPMAALRQSIEDGDL